MKNLQKLNKPLEKINENAKNYFIKNYSGILIRSDQKH